MKVVSAVVLAHLAVASSLVVPGARLAIQPARAMVCMTGGDLDTGTEPSLRDLVRKDRMVRRGGIAAGVTFLAGALALGGATGVIDPGAAVPFACVAAVLTAGGLGARFLSNEERGQPLDDSRFVVGASPGKGDGLFAASAIEAGTFLFDYEGESLDEDAFFARYPRGDGRYIACINDGLYVDGARAELSNMARWMNHAPPADANVVWKKQRLGPKPAMHFYATRRIAAGDELCFDYGDEYWQALGETPV